MDPIVQGCRSPNPMSITMWTALSGVYNSNHLGLFHDIKISQIEQNFKFTLNFEFLEAHY